MLEGTAGIVGRVDVDALDLPGELLLQRFECEQVIAKDKSVIEQVVVGNAMGGMVRLLTVLQQDARLQLRPVLLPDPGKFEFLLLRHAGGAPKEA